MAAFRIRAARPEDVDELIALIVDHARFERSSAIIERDRLFDLLADDTSPVEIFVASDEMRVGGYGALTLDFSLWRARNWAHLDCLFVNRHYRNQGLGKLLFRHAISLADQRSTDRLEWQTPEWNDRAIAFYQREGATSQRKMRFFLPI